MTDNKQHDWFTPEGRVAAWNEIDKNLPGVREAYEEEKIKKGNYILDSLGRERG